MACNCIKNYREMLKEKFNDSANVNYVIFSDGTARMVVTGYFYPLKKDGSRFKKPKDINLMANYCPFCWKSYDQGEE